MYKDFKLKKKEILKKINLYNLNEIIIFLSLSIFIICFMPINYISILFLKILLFMLFISSLNINFLIFNSYNLFEFKIIRYTLKIFLFLEIIHKLFLFFHLSINNTLDLNLRKMLLSYFCIKIAMTAINNIIFLKSLNIVQNFEQFIRSFFFFSFVMIIVFNSLLNLIIADIYSLSFSDIYLSIKSL